MHGRASLLLDACHAGMTPKAGVTCGVASIRHDTWSPAASRNSCRWTSGRTQSHLSGLTSLKVPGPPHLDALPNYMSLPPSLHPMPLPPGARRLHSLKAPHLDGIVAARRGYAPVGCSGTLS